MAPNNFTSSASAAVAPFSASLQRIPYQREPSISISSGDGARMLSLSSSVTGDGFRRSIRHGHRKRLAVPESLGQSLQSRPGGDISMPFSVASKHCAFCYLSMSQAGQSMLSADRRFPNHRIVIVLVPASTLAGLRIAPFL
jgi:hypothetical protein